ncbi:MAG: hypothetical protein WC802_00895 [Patescibacteria group bacterium]
MIAEVFPNLRLPRRFSFFDYKIPDSMTVAVGDLVAIPFRGREIIGLVAHTKETSAERKLSQLANVVHRSWCEPEDIVRLETIARAIVQSPASLFHGIFDGVGTSDAKQNYIRLLYNSLSVKKIDVEQVGEILKSPDRVQTVFGDKVLGAVLASALVKTTTGQCLFLVPTEKDAKDLQTAIKSSVVYHGHIKPRDRASIARAWHEGKIRILVGTRGASLIPAHELSAVVVLDSANDEHASTRRNPRFDAREAVKLLASQHSARLFFVDPLPRLEELAPSLPAVRARLASPPSFQIIDLRNALLRSDDPLLTEPLLEGIESALQSGKKVLLFLNRKGVAKRLQCGACGHIPLCGTCGNVPSVRLDDLVCDRCGTEMWIPKNCPACGKAKLAMKGIGGAKIAEILRTRFSDATVGQIEKGKIENPYAPIVIVTEYFFSSFLDPFKHLNLGLVADLAGDMGIHGADFRGAEKTARKLHRLLAFAKRENANCILQTWLPDVLTPMLNLDTFIKDELELRQRYQLPPFSSRYVLEGAKIGELPEALRSIAREHDETVEIRPLVTSGCDPTPSNPLSPSLTLLPDSVKITLDGPYEIPPRSPQPE